MRPRLALLGGGRRRRGLEPHGLRDLLDRGSLGVAHALAGEAHEALPVGLRDSLGETDDEAAVLLLLGGLALRLEQLDGIADVLEQVSLHSLDRGEPGLVDLRLRGDDLVDELAPARLLLRLGVCLRHRKALADRPAALRKGDVHARARWALEKRLPLLVAEVGLRSHRVSFVARNAANFSCGAELRELHGHRDLNEETAMATEQKTQAQDGTVASTGADTLSVTDNRNGETYEMEITDGTVRAMDFRQIKVAEDDFGLMTYDPAFTNTASCRSAITFIDGEKGILQHRGIPIEQLCEKSSYLEVAYLLTFGELPTKPQLDRWVFDVTHHTFVHEDIKNLFETFRYDAHPMGMLLSGVGALSTFYPDAKDIDDPEERYMAAIRLIAKVPTLAAFAYRHNMGLPYVYPDNDLDYAGNFLSMLYKKTEVKYEPDERLRKALDVLFILHADHEQNCSTSAVRGVGSSEVDPYSAVAAGVAALYGPLHGGANEAVLRMLRRIESVDNIPDFLQRVKDREEKLMGFGHRVYKNYDPRARIIQQHMDDVFAATEYNPLIEIAQELEKRALDDEYFTERKLYPNVDFYSGIIYEALQIPNEMFTVIFAIPRTSGWVAQWMEGNDDSEQKIARPRQVYTGARDRDYVAIEDRDGPEKITGPPARRPKRQRRGA